MSSIRRIFGVSFICFILVSAGGLGSATILYRVKPLPESSQLAVEVSFSAKSAETIIQVPHWMPGFYMLQETGRNVKEYTAATSDGHATVESVDGQTWKIKAKGRVIVRYKVPFEFREGIGHYSGTPTY